MIPALSVSSVPIAIEVALWLPLNWFSTPMPIAFPIGVMTADASDDESDADDFRRKYFSYMLPSIAGTAGRNIQP
jgi:hypothetical protein